ncbi:MAG: ATP-binding protein [Eubacteriales bacterium]|nr:ATP-binding protein [Eubacteriales bacterium]
MTKKIFKSILSVALVILLSSLVMIIGVLYDYFRGVQKNQLRTELAFAAEGVEVSGAAYLEGLNDDSCRITLVGEDGTVLYDSVESADKMGNHADREEIKEAREYGTGEASRYSSTLTEQTIYISKLLSDGSVLRVSVSHATVPALVFGMLQPLIVVLLLAFILSSVLAHRLSEKIVEPLSAIDLDKPLENNTYDELAPVLSHIEKQHRQIARQMYDLDRSRSEFEAVTHNMKEGLVLTSEKGEIISINPSAASFFLGVKPDSAEFYEHEKGCIGKDFLTLDRSRETHELIERAQANGEAESRVSRWGREYQLNASRVLSDGKFTGIVLLIFDVTDKVFAERNRREFTANVSHELKTPLQSIMGSAELIENGLVKPEDMKDFSDRIYKEAARLLTLIEDIIRLSQLDENVELAWENLDIAKMASDTAALLRDTAEKKNVIINLDCEPTEIYGVRQLYSEIIYNLCENAIKYNKDGGSVTVSVHPKNGGIELTVSDTGIGIPPEHRSRVFERFYRVDKSHSKATGGTGLGLSIVKHAVQYLGGQIDLTSRVGEGTKITVFFPNKEWE